MSKIKNINKAHKAALAVVDNDNAALDFGAAIARDACKMDMHAEKTVDYWMPVDWFDCRSRQQVAACAFYATLEVIREAA
jgi:hypothetical protein